MRKVKVIVEPADCGFSAYMADSGLDYSCIGEGTSTEETVEDFNVGVDMAFLNNRLTVMRE